MTESNKNNSRNKTDTSLGKIVPTAAYLDKKPIRVRKKSRALQNDNPQVLNLLGDKELKIKSAQTQNLKRKTLDPTGLPWKRKRNVWLVTEDGYTFGPPPKSTKIFEDPSRPAEPLGPSGNISQLIATKSINNNFFIELLDFDEPDNLHISQETANCKCIQQYL